MDAGIEVPGSMIDGLQDISSLSGSSLENNTLEAATLTGAIGIPTVPMVCTTKIDKHFHFAFY